MHVEMDEGKTRRHLGGLVRGNECKKEKGLYGETSDWMGMEEQVSGTNYGVKEWMRKSILKCCRHIHRIYVDILLRKMSE